MWDMNNGEFLFGSGDDSAFNEDGDTMERVGDDTALNMDTGEIDIVSSCDDE